jgi:hypothetical protein
MIHNEFNLFEMRRHTPSGRIFVPLQNFVFPIDNIINCYLTVILHIQQTNNGTNFFIDVMVTDVINKLSVIVSPNLTDTDILLGLSDIAIYNMRNSVNVNVPPSKYMIYKTTAVEFAVDNLICKIVNNESNNTNKIIELKCLILEFKDDYELTNAKSKLDELLIEEAHNRFLSKKAKTIQKQFKISISDPSFKLCRSRLLKEYNEFP